MPKNYILNRPTVMDCDPRAGAFGFGFRLTGDITAKATESGVEQEVTTRIMPGMTLTAAFGNSHVEFDEFTDAFGDYKGNRNPF